jgi:hypothetical protein
MDRVDDMFQRVGMNDEVEGSVGVGQTMHVDLGVGGEDVTGEPAQEGAQVASFVDFQDRRWRSTLGYLLQRGSVAEERPYRVGKRDRAKIRAASVACRSLLPIDVGDLIGRNLSLGNEAWPCDPPMAESRAAAYPAAQRD